MVKTEKETTKTRSRHHGQGKQTTGHPPGGHHMRHMLQRGKHGLDPRFITIIENEFIERTVFRGE